MPSSWSHAFEMRGFFVVLVVAALATACGSDNGDNAVPAPPGSGPTTSLPETTTEEDQETLEPQPDSDLSDGRYIAKIIEINEERVIIDFVGWFTGAAAQREASNRGEQAPGNFLLVNDHPKHDQVPLGKDLVITSVWAEFERRGEITPVEIELSTLISYFRDPKDIATNIVSDPFWITIEAGQVVRLDEQYVA